RNESLGVIENVRRRAARGPNPPPHRSRPVRARRAPWMALLLAVLAGQTAIAAAQPAPVLVNVLSRKVHGAAGTFDLALALTQDNPTTEPRQGPSQTLVFAFDKPVT